MKFGEQRASGCMGIHSLQYLTSPLNTMVPLNTCIFLIHLQFLLDFLLSLSYLLMSYIGK